MADVLDKLIPLTAFPALGALTGWLVSLAAGHTAIAVTVGAFAGLLALIILGALLPDES